MGTMGVLVSRNNSDIESEIYIFPSTIHMIESIILKIVLVLYSIVLIVSVIQTFWKNKRIDRLLAYMNEAYSDGKFGSNQVCYRQQIIICYRFDQRFSFIPNANRLILPIIATHIQILMLIAIKTSFIRRTELVNDCSSFLSPYKVLQCEDNRDPCGSNNTRSVPKCTYYYFEMSHLITMVTSIITWQYALRYLVVKLVRVMRWVLFRDDDHPRMLFYCYQPTQRRVRFIMYFQYIILWLYFFFVILFGFIWNLDLARISNDKLESVWQPIVLATERLFSLIGAIAPELLQNWLDVSEKLKFTQVPNLNEWHLANLEPLVYLTNKKRKLSTLYKTNASQSNVEVITESTTHM